MYNKTDLSMYQIAFQLEEPDYVKLEEEESIVIRFKKKKNSSKKYNNATLKINTEAFRSAVLSKCVDNHSQVIKANKNYTAPYKSILENSRI